MIRVVILAMFTAMLTAIMTMIPALLAVFLVLFVAHGGVMLFAGRLCHDGAGKQGAGQKSRCDKTFHK
jgi:hypothetical protein